MMITSVYVQRDGQFVLLGQCRPLPVGVDNKTFSFREPIDFLLQSGQMPRDLRHYTGRVEYVLSGGVQIPILVIGTEDDPHWIPGFIWRKDVRDVKHGDV